VKKWWRKEKRFCFGSKKIAAPSVLACYSVEGGGGELEGISIDPEI